MSTEPERDPFAAVLALKAIPELAPVPPDELVGLASRAVERRYAAGAPIEGASEAVLLLLEGRARAAGHVHEAPALLGLVPVLAGAAAPPLVADGDVLALALERGPLLDLLEEEFELWLAAARIVCRSGAPGLVAQARGGRALADPCDLADRIAALRRLAPFAGLRISLLGEIAAGMERRVVDPADRVVWRAGDPATRALWIGAGEVELELPDGRAPRRAGAGVLVGLAETLAGTAYRFGLRARKPLEVLVLDGEALVDALEDDAAAAVELLCALAREACRANEGRGRLA